MERVWVWMRKSSRLSVERRGLSSLLVSLGQEWCLDWDVTASFQMLLEQVKFASLCRPLGGLVLV